MATLDYAAFSSDELEFMAENELVRIEPKFTHAEPVNFIMGDFGPFSPGVPVLVPLWFAVRLRQDSLCRIIPPAWLSVGMSLFTAQILSTANTWRPLQTSSKRR